MLIKGNPSFITQKALPNKYLFLGPWSVQGTLTNDAYDE